VAKDAAGTLRLGLLQRHYQVLGYAVRTKLLDENVAQAVANPEPKRREVQAFATPEDVEAVADELAAEYRLIPILAAWTGLRPEEWLALERGDIDAGGSCSTFAVSTPTGR
jgi:integrase